MQLYQKQKLFLNFFFHLQNWYSILIILKKQMTLIAYEFLKWRTPKNMVR